MAFIVASKKEKKCVDRFSIQRAIFNWIFGEDYVDYIIGLLEKKELWALNFLYREEAL